MSSLQCAWGLPQVSSQLPDNVSRVKSRRKPMIFTNHPNWPHSSLEGWPEHPEQEAHFHFCMLHLGHSLSWQRHEGRFCTPLSFYYKGHWPHWPQTVSVTWREILPFFFLFVFFLCFSSLFFFPHLTAFLSVSGEYFSLPAESSQGRLCLHFYTYLTACQKKSLCLVAPTKLFSLKFWFQWRCSFPALWCLGGPPRISKPMGPV